MKYTFITALMFLALGLPGAKFVPGISGKALDGRAPLAFDPARLTPQGGSALFWFKLSDGALPLKRHAMLLGLGINKPGWFYIYLGRGHFGVNVRSAKSSARVECSASAVKPGEWYHAAVVWGKRKEGFCRIYLNGKLSAYQRLEMPEKFSSSNLAVGYNASHWKSPSFPGAIDELALFDVPLSEEMIQKIMAAGKKGKPSPELPGRLLYFPFEGNTTPTAGKSTPPEEAKKLLREAYRKAKITKYPDEVAFRYTYSQPTREKTPDILCDGNNGTGVSWRQLKVAVTGEFETTQNVTEIEIVTRKYTKWYLLKQLQVSWDDGSGNFGDPVIINTYAYGKPISKKLIDESCKEYVYTVKNPGKMCRFKIALVGDGHYGLNEIRVRAKK